MKRFVLGALVAFYSLFAAASPTYATTQDFHFSNFQADYYLSRDVQKRSVLKTVEVLTAEFPSFDQNHGIERAIPKSYDGHPTHLKVNSVTDALGKNLPYTTYDIFKIMHQPQQAVLNLVPEHSLIRL